MTRLVWCLLVTMALFLPASAQAVIGQPAADFSLKDLAGRTHSLDGYRGQTVVAVFLSTECPFSNAYLDRIRAVANEYAARKVAVLGINAQADEPVEKIRAHAVKNDLRFPILKDEGSRIADLYGATRTPEVFVIDPAGTLRYHGRIDNAKDPAQVRRSDLREALDELLAGKPVGVAETKSFGCLIKMTRKTTAERRPSPAPAGLAFGFLPQAPKRPAARRPAASTGGPVVAPLKPAEFVKFKDAAKGKVLVINFWATWCGPCVAEFPEFVAIDEKYRAQGVKVVGISADDMDDLKTKVVSFLKEHKATFENRIQDTEDPQEMIDIVDKEWPGVLPATFVYDKTGQRVYKHYGIIDRAELVAAIEKAMK